MRKYNKFSYFSVTPVIFFVTYYVTGKIVGHLGYSMITLDHTMVKSFCCSFRHKEKKIKDMTEKQKNV